MVYLSVSLFSVTLVSLCHNNYMLLSFHDLVLHTSAWPCILDHYHAFHQQSVFHLYWFHDYIVWNSELSIHKVFLLAYEWKSTFQIWTVVSLVVSKQPPSGNCQTKSTIRAQSSRTYSMSFQVSLSFTISSACVTQCLHVYRTRDCTSRICWNEYTWRQSHPWPSWCYNVRDNLQSHFRLSKTKAL